MIYACGLLTLSTSFIVLSYKMEEYLSMTDLSASQFVKGSVCFLELCPVTNHPYSYYLFKLPTSETRLRLSLLTWLGATENNGCEGAKNKKTPYITHAQG